MAKTIIKEIIIILLLLLAIILALGVLFYDYIPTNRTIPTVGTYKTSESVQTELEEKITQDDTVLVTYEITSADLKTLEKTKDYTKGKENPFSTYENVNGSSNGAVGSANNGTTNTSSTNTSTSSGNSGNFYKNTGTK